MLVHRDVSPGNVLLSTVGEVKIGDFGVALAREPDDVAGADRLVVGKLGYMAPEQHAGEPVDPRADLFSVAVVIFELLTHERPFVGRSPAERQAAAALGRARPAAPLRADVTAGLETWLAKALRRSPEDRFPTARSMAAALAELQGEGHLVAGADDLAEAVEQACASAPRRGKPVVLLGADPGEQAPSVGELTRTGAARFTMRLGESRGSAGDEEKPLARTRREDPLRPEADPPAGIPTRSTVVEGAAEPPRTAARRAAWIVLAAAGAAVSAALVVMAMASTPANDRSTPEPRAAGGDRTGSAEAGTRGDETDRSVELSRAAARDPSAAAGTGAASATTGETPATGASSPTASRGPAERGAATASTSSTRADEPLAGSTGAAPSAANGCEGDLHLYASHGWTVSGGPSNVQAPGRYRWPCGSYALRALSRLDPAVTKPLSVVVRQGQTAIVDLRP
jgi:serine/threonine-protein kinase